MAKNVIDEKGLDAQELALDALEIELLEEVKLYNAPTAPEVKEQLEWFQDQKFGLMVHWGLYNEVGIKESWTWVDRPWTTWQFKPGTPKREVKEMYNQLHKGFLPLRFDPEEWAEQAADAGFRYLCFTTKHHDGFCMWDTKTTDYKVTGSEVPWRTHKHADITKALYNAFRAKGMGISLYFSRADFSCPYYWEEGYAMQDGSERVPSYDIDANPEKWQKFKDYVYAQLEEIVSGYGKIDILWYDGGCDGVKLGMPEMSEKLRKIQPWMLSVLRSPAGYADFLTPELFVPSKALPVPWETCTVMGKPLEEYGTSKYVSFGYTFDQDYKSAKEVAHLLLDIVCKGGNLALNIAPQPDGRLPGRALRELKVLGEWMRIFGSAIYATRAIAPYREGPYVYTRSKDSKKINVFYLYNDNELVPERFEIPFETGKALKVTDLRSGKALEFTQSDSLLTVTLPKDASGQIGDIADCVVIEL